MATKTKIVQIDGRNYRISELPTLVARDVMMNYPLTLLPKVGNYGENERLFKLLMKHVEVQPEPDKNPDWWIRLDTEDSINQNVSAKGVLELEKEVIDFQQIFFEWQANPNRHDPWGACPQYPHEHSPSINSRVVGNRYCDYVRQIRSAVGEIGGHSAEFYEFVGGFFDPIIDRIIYDRYATLREIEENYSFNDLCKIIACLNRRQYDIEKSLESNKR